MPHLNTQRAAARPPLFLSIPTLGHRTWASANKSTVPAEPFLLWSVDCSLSWAQWWVAHHRCRIYFSIYIYTKAKSFLDWLMKRGRTEDATKTNVTLPAITFRKFLVMHSENEDQPLAKRAPFLVAKTLEILIGKCFEVKELSPGNLLVEVATAKQSTALLELNQVRNYKVSVAP